MVDELKVDTYQSASNNYSLVRDGIFDVSNLPNGLYEVTNPNPNRANKLLWSRVQGVLSGQYEHILAIAQLNDTLRDAEYGNKPYKAYNPDITEKDGVYTLAYGYERTYIINTTGKKLEEGGEWGVQVKYGTYMEPYKLGTVTGVVGEPTKFSIDFEDLYAYRAPYSNALKADIEYYYNEPEECVDITFATAEGYGSLRFLQIMCLMAIHTDLTMNSTMRQAAGRCTVRVSSQAKRRCGRCVRTMWSPAYRGCTELEDRVLSMR